MLSKSKRLLFAKQAEITKAIAHPVRIAILDFLKEGEYVGSERSNVSRHLSVMLGAGVLESRKQGLKVIYKLKTPCILDCFSCISTCLKQQVKETEKLLAAL